jgi:hypothetical protein
MTKKQHFTNKGKPFDLMAISAKHEHDIALGNSKMNARGDILGKNGQIEIKREKIIDEYYKNNNNPVKNVSIKDMINNSSFETPSQAMARLAKQEEERLASLPEKPTQKKPTDKE